MHMLYMHSVLDEFPCCTGRHTDIMSTCMPIQSPPCRGDGGCTAHRAQCSSDTHNNYLNWSLPFLFILWPLSGKLNHMHCGAGERQFPYSAMGHEAPKAECTTCQCACSIIYIQKLLSVLTGAACLLSYPVRSICFHYVPLQKEHSLLHSPPRRDSVAHHIPSLLKKYFQ